MKLESTITVLNNVKKAKEEMVKTIENGGYIDPTDATNTELSCISALLSDIAMSLAIIADHFTDKKGDVK